MFVPVNTFLDYARNEEDCFADACVLCMCREVEYSPQILHKYKKALDTSVKIATCFNVTPIRGNTIIYVNQGNRLKRPCSSARGLGKPRTV